MPERVSTSETAPNHVSALLRAWTDGDQHPLARLAPIVYNEFHRLAHSLNVLTARAPRKATVVELRFFGGLSVEETAEVLRVSPITVMREWNSAKAWLYRKLAGPTAHGQ